MYKNGFLDKRCKDLHTITSKNETIKENIELTQFYKERKTL
jgi:hypothetical protein